jgi:hypothetical protein
MRIAVGEVHQVPHHRRSESGGEDSERMAPTPQQGDAAGGKEQIRGYRNVSKHGEGEGV